MTACAFARPNLLGRLYIGLAQTGLAAQGFDLLEMKERIDPMALRRAVSALLDEWPQLRSLVVRHWYGYRRIAVELAAVDLDEVVTVSNDPESVDALLQRECDLTREPPIQVLLHQGAAEDRLVVGLHHSVADGEAVRFVIARLGEHYGAALSGERIPSVNPSSGREPRYRDLLALLPWTDRLRVCRQALGYFWSAAGLPGSSRPVPLATFIDRPLPASGRLRYARVSISFDDVAVLMRQAVKRRGSLSDLVLTATLRAAIAVWREQAARPIRVSLPVDVRSADEVAVSNRVCGIEFDVDAGGFDEMFAQVSTAMARARAVTPAVMNALTYVLVSYLPPAVFEHVARGYFARTTNARESLTFTVMRTFDAGPRRFGPVTVADAIPVASVIAPPGLRLVMSPHGGRLNLCVSYLDPVIAPERIHLFTDAIRVELAAVA